MAILDSFVQVHVRLPAIFKACGMCADAICKYKCPIIMKYIIVSCLIIGPLIIDEE
jgi:hypothetical protein